MLLRVRDRAGVPGLVCLVACVLADVTHALRHGHEPGGRAGHRLQQLFPEEEAVLADFAGDVSGSTRRRCRRDIVEKIREASNTRLLSSGSLGSSFSQGYIDLGSRDLVEEGAATLAFVFDTTGSMSDDLMQVINGASRILKTVLEKFERPIHNYVLVPFHDPNVGPMTVTTNPEEFLLSLQDLTPTISGGGDCPEMAVRAIKMALETSVPSSYIYVFTDARAKDYHLLDDVLKLIQKKQSQVVFVMTGDCGNHTHAGYKAFQSIASTSSGQIFHLDKSNVNKVLTFVELSLESRKVNLLSLDRETLGPGEENLPLLVDQTLKQFTISVAGKKPKIEIYGPRGEDVTRKEGVEELLTLENVKVLGVKEPEPGRYNISVGSESEYTVRATGLSSLNFEHGFSLKPTTNFKETYHRPVKGGISYVVVRPHDVTEFGDIYRLQLVSLDGEVLEDMPLTRLPGSGPVFNGTAFPAPDVPFNIKIFGRDQDGYQFERISPTATTAQLPFPPEVTSASRVYGYFGRPAVIICHVHTLVPFRLSWQRDGIDLGPSVTHPQSAEVEYVVESPQRDDEGRYTCIATNSAGSTSSTVFLDMKEPPPQITAAEEVSLPPSRPAVLTCDVYSTVEHNVTWSRYIIKGQVQDYFGKTETIGEFVNVKHVRGYRMLSNTSLLLENVTSNDEGWFRCTAANEGGRSSREVHVSVQSPPQVTVVPEVAPFSAGDNVTVSCVARGFPEPQVSWRRYDVQIGRSYTRVREDEGHELHVANAVHDDEGPYVCMASSSAGSAEATVTLAFMEEPKVMPVQDQVLAASGDTAWLQCYAEGTPSPSITWLKEGKVEVAPMSFIEVEDGNLKIHGVQRSDAGTYTCVASNVAGTSQANVVLEVGSPPSVVQAPADTVVEIGSTGGLSCYGVGVPEPSITWRREDGAPLPPHITHDRDGNLRVQGMKVEDEGTYLCTLENLYDSVTLRATISVSGLLAPLIAAPPDPNLKATLDAPVTLPCTVIMANPPPDLVWLHDGVPVRSSKGMVIKSDGTLSIFSVSVKHEGEYQCVATNVAGNSSQTLNLKILVPPRAKSKRVEDNVEALEGDVVKLKCPVKADPRPTFFWHKNGQPISRTSPRMRVLQDGILVIRQLLADDAGTYVCTAVNAAGATKIAVVLDVHVPPTIAEGPASYTVGEGEVVEIECVASGAPLPSITWVRQDQTLLLDQTMPDGTLRMVATMESEGQYECMVTNVAGSAHKTVVVLISKAPEISPPGDETLAVSAGQDLKLPCEVKGHPEPEVSWRRNGLALAADERLVPSPGYLLMSAVTPDLAGNYTCSAINQAGNAHKTFAITVNYPPQVETVEETWPERSVVEGGRLSLPCPALANPTPTRDWTKDGVRLLPEEGLEILESGTVEVSRAEPKHSGSYRCTLTNFLGQAHIDYDVKVLIPPRVTQRHRPSAPIVVEGEDVVINCPVDAVPIPTITWLKDGVSIFSTKDRADMTHIVVENNGQTLYILEATVDDKGVYRCVAKNDAGVTELLFPLEVLVAPQFTEFFHNPDVTLHAGEELDLDCEVSGDPEPQVSWKRDGEPLYAHVSPGGRRVHVQHAKVGHAGHYTCTAVNTAGTTHRNFSVTVLKPPTMEDGGADDLTGVETVEGRDAKLWCRADGSPAPEIVWTKDRQLITPLQGGKYSTQEEGQMLTIHEVSPESSGLYECTATNFVGTATRIFNVSVMTPPTIRDAGGSDVVTDVQVVSGREAILYCGVEGSPPPSITWLRDGRTLKPGPRVHFTGPYELLLTSVQAGDAGDYACLATNRAGTAEKQFDIRVIVPATIADDEDGSPPMQEVLVDMPFSLFCPVEGTPQPRITWTKNSAPLDGLLGFHGLGGRVALGDGGRRLLVSEAVMQDSGTYMCVAENEGGRDTATYQVNVLAPPVIIQDKDTFRSAVEGDDVVLDCEVDGDPPPAIVWLQDGVSLQELYMPAITVHDVGRGKSELRIKGVSEIHAGSYTCIASSVAGSDEQTYVLRVVTPPRLEDPNAPTYVSVRASRPASLSCLIHASPDPQIFWFKNNMPLDEDDPNLHLSAGGRDLKLLQVTEGDAANYSCLATNEAGSLSVNFTLEVHVPPRFTESVVGDVNAVAGEDVELFCPVHATPAPSVLWMRDSGIIQHSFTATDPRRLTLQNVTKEDDGRYTCLATNEAGTIEQDFTLSVMVAPKLLDLDQPVVEKSVVLNRPVTITCFIVADPPPTITWLKDGHALSALHSGVSVDNHGRQVSITRARGADAGNYTCLATNAAGTTTLTTLLTVLTPPTWATGSELEEKVIGVAGESLDLFCDVTGTPTPTILWLKDGQIITPLLGSRNFTASDRLLHFNSLAQDDSGLYSCITSNAAGTAEYVFDVDVLAPPSLSYQPKTQHTVLVNRALSLDCPVEGNPEPEIKWFMDDQPVNAKGQFVRLTSQARQLHLLRVLSSSEGRVTCLATNAVGSLVTNYTLDVLSPPVITPTPATKKVRAREGDSVTLTCRTRGHPRPQVAWVGDQGKVLTEEEMARSGFDLQEEGESLVIKKVDGAHEGRYTCIASNTAGSAEETFNLQVLLPPVIQVPEQGAVLGVVQGSSVTLTCIVDARPPATLSWQKNGQTLDSSRDPFLHVTAGGDSLSFLRVQPQHAANYTCVASSAAGQDSLTYDLNVNVPPVIIEDMVENVLGGGVGGDTMGIVGGEVDLECYTIGTPTPTLTWEKDDEGVEPSDRITLLENGQVLRLKSAITEDSGRYTCTATSPSGSASRDFVVVIHSPPRIIPPRETNLEVVLHQPVALTCEAESSLTPAVSWSRHGRPITPYVDPNLQVRTGGRELHLRRVREGDGGAFTCIVMNSAGQDTLTYTLTVQVPPVIQRANVRRQVVGVAGQSTDLLCEASGNPPPTLAWTRGNTLVTPEHPHYQVMNGGAKLQVRELTREDTGVITCTATNPAGKDTLSYTLQVYVPPSVDEDAAKEMTVKEGNSVVLECPVTAFPAPSILWSVGGTVVGHGGRRNVDLGSDGRSLRIVRAGSENAGVYTCTASNTAGVLDVEVALRVLVPPQIARGNGRGQVAEGEEELVTVMEGGHVALQCILLKGTPTPTRQWFVGPELAEPVHTVVGNGEQLVITRAEEDDSGQYRCIAENPAGSATKLYQLVVQSAPRINVTALPPYITVLSPGDTGSGILPADGRPRHSHVSASATSSEDQTLILTCPVTGYPPPRRLWYQGSQALVSSSRVLVGTGGRDLTLVGVGPRDAGTYVCVAVNPAGEAQLSTAVVVVARPELEGEAEVEVAVVEGQDVSFECKVKTNGRSSAAHATYNITWMKDGQELPRNEVPQTRSFERLLMGRRPLPVSDYYYEGEEDFSYAEDVSLLLQDYLEGVSAETTSPTATTPEPTDASGEAPLDGWRDWRGGRNGTARYHTLGGGTRLRVSRVTERDEGAYACVVTNLAGATTRTFQLDTLVPPDIDTIQEVNDHVAAVGEPVVFECDARGDPPPEVTWYRGSAPLEHHSRLQLLEENHVLIITSIQEGDGGEYTCLATNLAGLTEETFRLNVLVPPRIAGGEEQAVPVVSGRSVELECEAQGQPEPDLIWTFEGEPVTESENLVLDDNTLIIDRVKLAQAGVYECAATNSVGQDARRFVVSVTEAPFIAGGVDEETVTVVEGESAALHCVASGHPEPLVTWMKEGVGMRLDERVTVSWGGRSLLLQYVGEEDAGRYTCVASNLAGNHTKDFRVQVLRRPQLVDAPEEVVAVVGEIVNVVCAFEAYPRPKISWQFEGAPVDGEDSVLPSGVLQISPVGPEHAGNYTCFANNEAGSANHTLTLTVQTPPWVEVGQTRKVVVSGESATLECKAGGVPAPSITWLKGHQVVNRGVEFEPDESGSLYIPFVTPDLADTYVCTARSSAGSAHAHTELVVQESPVAFGAEDEVVAAVGQQVVLRCEVSGQPTPAVTWTRPNHANTPVTPEDPRVQLTDDSLIIMPVAVEDMGLYQCTATNPAGQDNALITLTVHSPPSVTEPLSEFVNVVRGEPLNLGCTGAGYPPPRTTWIKEGRTLTENAALTLATTGDLVISNTKASDSGLYICLVTNAAGRLYREVTVVVQVPPRFSVLPRTQQVTRGDRFELDCEAVGTPVPTIRWLLNGTQVAGVGQSRGGRGVLVVEKAAKTDEGTYTCIAENAAGHRKAVAGIRVKVPPVIMYAPEEMTVLELNAVTLTCVAEGDPAPATTWTKEGHSVHSSDRVHLMDNGSLVIDSSQASDAGEYKCVVSNDAGAAEATAHLVVHTPPMLTRPPVSKVVEVGGTVVFDCEAEGSPLPEIQWSVSPGEMHARYIRLTNGSLQLIAAQIEDEGHVICQAYNELGEDLAKADLSVKVSGMWASWGPWTSCSVSCGPGQQTRRRLCNAPAPRHGGAPCPGDEAHTRPCRPQPCPLDGNWSPWDPWGECSVTCGSGVRVRTRYCSAPAPLYGGRPCDGNAAEEEPCSLRDCPVSGGWGEWTAWSDCSATCGQGLRQRTRLCDSPPPAAGGAHCQGDGLEVTPCSNPPCLLDGNWGAWAAWSVCSVSCGGGVRRRERACDDPPPSNGGRYCPGSNTLEDYCNLDMCPVNGGWSSWSSWGSCTATCGGGQRRRFRTCDNPGPSQGGRACTGPDTDSEACNTAKCPVNGAWGSWSEWSPCSMTCGLGMRVRTRLCNNPHPGFGGAPCVGEERETTSCEGDTCEVLPTLAKGTVIGELNGEDR
ncbi:hemicentin-1-like [Penaeus indicus]|uniref:hemicentin-1-like n=1 Tax=Penaeus indicus TaxID=29960 RepID=UPI00300D3561